MRKLSDKHFFVSLTHHPAAPHDKTWGEWIHHFPDVGGVLGVVGLHRVKLHPVRVVQHGVEGVHDVLGVVPRVAVPRRPRWTGPLTGIKMVQ